MTGGNGNGKRQIAIRIDEFKPMEKNTLRGFVGFTLLDLGLRVKGATIHQKEDSRWVSMPAREYTTTEGRKFSPIIEFDSKEARYALNDSGLAAFDTFHGDQPNRESGSPGDDPW